MFEENCTQESTQEVVEQKTIVEEKEEKTETDESPQTGDESNLGIIIIGLLSALGIAASCIYKKKYSLI